MHCREIPELSVVPRSARSTVIAVRSRFARRAGAVAALLLAAGAALPAPAFAAPPEPTYAAVYLTAHAVYPPDDWEHEDTRYWGVAYDSPAYAGHAPGSLDVTVEVVNLGTEPLHDISISTRVDNDGRVDDIRCAESPLTADDPQAGPGRGEPQEGGARKDGARKDGARKGPAQGGVAPLWPDPAFVLAPGASLYCAESLSDVKNGVTTENRMEVTAVGVDTGSSTYFRNYVWAAADPPAPPAPPPPPASVGHLVYVDTNLNYQWDAGEPGIAGARLSIKGPDGLPPPDYESGHGVIDAETTTDAHGEYHFRHLKPGKIYTVALDLSTPNFDDLTPWGMPLGTDGWSTATLTARTGHPVETYDTMNFGFQPKERLSISIDAPTTATAGTKINVKAHTYVNGDPRRAWNVETVLELRASGATTWTRVAELGAGYGANPHAWMTVTRSGWLRYRSPGNVYVTSSVSREVHVLVRTAPVALTAAAPTSVPAGRSLTVTGTITRAGAPFRTGRVVLERSSDADTWTSVADVRSTDGTLSATVADPLDGWYRFRYAGDSRTTAGTSPTRRVDVLPATTTSPSPRPPR